MRALFGIATIIGILLGHGATAQQQVYDLLPPKGAAYIRFANALGAELTIQSNFLPVQHLGAAADQRVTAYFAVDRVTGRTLSLDAQGAIGIGHAQIQAAAGSYVTVIVTAAPNKSIAVTSVVDQADFNQTRARLAFYNATTDCTAATLALAPDGPIVFPDVVIGATKSRGVNPVDAQLEVTCPGHAAASLALRGLEAGGMYSIWYMLPNGSPTAFLTRDTTAPWRL